MNIPTPFYQAHEEQLQWVKELGFYKEEIDIFSKHLESLSSRNTSMQQSEHLGFFQNQLVRSLDLVITLENELTAAQARLSILANSQKPGTLEQISLGDHSSFRERMNSFKIFYQQMKQNLKTFEKEWI